MATAGTPDDAEIRAAAWIARCVGRAETSPLREGDLAALAHYIEARTLAAREVLLEKNQPVPGVWIPQTGRIELVVGRGDRSLIVRLLQRGEVEGDIFIVLGIVPPYSARTVVETKALFIPADSFSRLLQDQPAIARRWLTSCAARVNSSNTRILEFLSLSLRQKVARLLLDEAVDKRLELPQRTLAAMLAVQRPSLNKVLKSLENRGIIAIAYSEIVILQSEALEAIATGNG